MNYNKNNLINCINTVQENNMRRLGERITIFLHFANNGYTHDAIEVLLLYASCLPIPAKLASIGKSGVNAGYVYYVLPDKKRLLTGKPDVEPDYSIGDMRKTLRQGAHRSGAVED